MTRWGGLARSGWWLSLPLLPAGDLEGFRHSAHPGLRRVGLRVEARAPELLSELEIWELLVGPLVNVGFIGRHPSVLEVLMQRTIEPDVLLVGLDV